MRLADHRFRYRDATLAAELEYSLRLLVLCVGMFEVQGARSPDVTGCLSDSD